MENTQCPALYLKWKPEKARVIGFEIKFQILLIKSLQKTDLKYLQIRFRDDTFDHLVTE